MQVLLDTQAFLWFIDGDPQLSKDALAAIQDVRCCAVGLKENVMKKQRKATLTPPANQSSGRQMPCTVKSGSDVSGAPSTTGVNGQPSTTGVNGEYRAVSDGR